ncbi:hypothetical protein KKB18_09425 [bacterium]|nr:hypothetical protein [bacterium]
MKTARKGSRKNVHLSFEEEADFLKSFEEKTYSGYIATFLESKVAYEKKNLNAEFMRQRYIGC